MFGLSIALAAQGLTIILASAFCHGPRGWNFCQLLLMVVACFAELVLHDLGFFHGLVVTDTIVAVVDIVAVDADIAVVLRLPCCRYSVLFLLVIVGYTYWPCSGCLPECFCLLSLLQSPWLLLLSSMFGRLRRQTRLVKPYCDSCWFTGRNLSLDEPRPNISFDDPTPNCTIQTN